MLKHIRNVRFQFADIIPDYQMGGQTCALFLSLRCWLPLAPQLPCLSQSTDSSANIHLAAGGKEASNRPHRDPGSLFRDWEHLQALCELVSCLIVHRQVTVLDLSRYHLLKPQYIYGRIKELQRAYRLRVLLCHVDVDDAVDPLAQVTKAALLNDCTLFCAWSPLVRCASTLLDTHAPGAGDLWCTTELALGLGLLYQLS